MRKLLFIFSILLFFVFFTNVYAKEKLSIQSVSLDSKSDTAFVGEDDSFDDLTLNLSLRFTNVNDFVRYKVVINNPTEDSYKIDNNSLINSNKYFVYEIVNDEIIKKNSKSTIYIDIKYKNEINENDFKNGIFEDNNSIFIDLTNNIKNNNPKTSNGLLSLFSLLLIIICISVIIIKSFKNKKIFLIVVICLSIIPISIYALEKLKITINTNIVVKNLPLAKDKLIIDNENNYSPYVLCGLVNGESTLCRVLYDVNSPYGLQVITVNPIATVKLGSNDPEVSGTGLTKAQNSYMRAITTLNEEALKYKDNNGIATDARCVGSNPLDKNYPDYLTGTERSNLYWNTGSYHYEWWLSSYRNKFFNSDTNSQTDENQLRLLGIAGFDDTSISSNYWLASRVANGVIAATSASYGHIWDTIRFSVRNLNNFGNYVSGSSILFMREGKDNTYDEKYNAIEFGLRPVFIINNKALISKGDGTINNPYVLVLPDNN